MSVYYINSELYHHGVKGMRWGVRHDRRPSGGRRSGTLSKAKDKLNDPEFKRKALKGAKVAVGIAAIYATHKVINNPEVLNKGKDLLLKSLNKTGPLKASIVNSAEFKLLAKAKEPAKAALDFFGSDKFAKAVTTAGVVATTASALRGKVKDLRENKVNGDALDKALTYTKKVSSIGEDVNTLAKATKGETTSSSSSNSSTSSNSSSTDSSGKPKTEFTKKGGSEKIYANKHLSSNDLRTLKEYRQKHSTPSYTMSIEEALDELGWLDKDR